MRQLASFARIIVFDKRGTGLSDRVAGIATLEERTDDVRAVMDAAVSRRAAMLGVSEGGSMSILFAATYPERTAALVLHTTFVGSQAPWRRQLSDDEFEAQVRERERERNWPHIFDMARFAPSVAADPAFRTWLATYIRASISLGAASMLSRMNRRIDIRPVLPTIRVPTLVLHHKDDERAPVEDSRFLAQQIPGAK